MLQCIACDAGRPHAAWVTVPLPAGCRGDECSAFPGDREGQQGLRGGVDASTELLTEMGTFNEELVKAGVMLAGEGLAPSSQGVRVRFAGEERTVVSGPFAETGELVAGFWIWQVRSLDEAIEWIKKSPFRDGEVEIRKIFETEDFGSELTPELREQEDRLRAEVAARQH